VRRYGERERRGLVERRGDWRGGEGSGREERGGDWIGGDERRGE
jgi:hypothetical protein